MKSKKNRKNLMRIGMAVYTLAIVGFTAYVLLDTFVVAREYGTVKNSDFYTDFETQTQEESIVENETETNTPYTITVTEYTEHDTTIYVADIVLSDIRYLKSAFADDTYGKNITEKTSDIAEKADAILAINGDYYGAQDSGYVIRNGSLYRDTKRSNEQEDLVIYTDGTFEIVKEGDVTAGELLADGALQVYSFGPGLIEDGIISVDENDEVGKAMTSNPRTAIGQIDALHYVMVVADGRTSESEGLSIFELAEFMKEYGVETAYNLDGGGSSTMYYNGEIINNPTTDGRKISERSVSDIVYIG